MEKEKEFFPLDIVENILSGTQKGSSDTTTIRVVDASAIVSEKLAGELGSDAEWKREGKIDWRRFGHVDVVDPFWMAHFRLLNKFQGGDYSSRFVEEWANNNFSVEGRHKKLSVDMQKAVSGKSDPSKAPKKKRGLVDRLLGRNKDVEE